MQFVKNVLVYIFGLFTFSFCYCFYEGITPKIILVSQFLPSICISYLLKVFRFDTGILRNSCALTENFEQTTTECSCFILDSVSHTCLQYLFVLHIYNNDLLNVNRSGAESCCSLGFSCTLFSL